MDMANKQSDLDQGLQTLMNLVPRFGHKISLAAQFIVTRALMAGNRQFNVDHTFPFLDDASGEDQPVCSVLLISWPKHSMSITISDEHIRATVHFGAHSEHVWGRENNLESHIEAADWVVEQLNNRNGGVPKETPHPNQPSVMVGRVLRFKENRIVSELLASSTTWDLHRISAAVCTKKFCVQDYRQVNQLIGFSLSGYSDITFPDES